MDLGMKRAYSESDDEEGYSSERCLEDDETTARKRRRGLIEKKRRDRINSCLTELRRLVPAAVDKQGSTKLEKAEILQLTVEHLKNVRNVAKRETGADYRAAGFRECLSEVSRYLQGFRDPNCKEDQKAQLMNHLNTIISHRLYQSRPPMPPSVVWPREVASATLPLTADTRVQTGQPLTTMMHDDHAINKDKPTMTKNQNMLLPTAIPDTGLLSVKPNSYPSFTMYPNTPHCTRNDNLMLPFPFAQHTADNKIKSEQIMLGPDPSMIKSLFCHPF